MFSISASSSEAASSSGRTSAGTAVEAGELCGAPAALAGDQLVRAAGHGADEHGLEHAALLEGLGQRDDRALVELLARLVRVRHDQLDGNLAQLAAALGVELLAGARIADSPRPMPRVGQPRDATSLASAK